jgi:hypothetical protein
VHQQSALGFDDGAAPDAPSRSRLRCRPRALDRPGRAPLLPVWGRLSGELTTDQSRCSIIAPAVVSPTGIYSKGRAPFLARWEPALDEFHHLMRLPSLSTASPASSASRALESDQLYAVARNEHGPPPEGWLDR